MSNIQYSPVSQDVISILEKNNCWAEDWGKVSISSDFKPGKVVGTAFKGTVKIGALGKTIDGKDGVSYDSGIYYASLNNVTLGDNVAIKNIGGWLNNLNVGSDVIISNVGTIACTKESSFGNGYEIDVLNEGGGRELKLTSKTSAQAAYLNILYRDKIKLVKALDKIADNYAKSVTSTIATIADKVQIFNAKEIINVSIGEAAIVNGAQSLTNGTINSSVEAPSLVGNGVFAENFICLKGSTVDSGVMLDGALVGEGSKLGKQFSAENSAFFANSEGYHSEAVAYLGGPYSVTHHRSTLMIAALTSFYNAGSGTNQSNHMYKLGPLHQGLMERGSKTGSFSYLLWPSKIGPFSAVLGKHYANFDVSNFPFSYIDDIKGRSTIVPGMNFFTVGTLRDGDKWPNRDKRKNKDTLDKIIFDILSPFTGQKMIKGQGILMDLYEKSEKGQEWIVYNGINIKRLLLKTSKRYYKIGLEKYFGDLLLKRIAKEKPSNLKDLFKTDTAGVDGASEWIDVLGLLAAKPRVEKIIKAIEDGSLSDIDAVNNSFQEVFDAYEADEWNWFMTNFEKVFGVKPGSASNEDLVEMAEAWKKSSGKLIKLVLNDAEKEFEGEVRTGFGIDGNGDADFDQVRGKFNDNSFVQKLQKDLASQEDGLKVITDLIK